MPKSPDAFRTISEVADWLGVQAHVLRFWESKFSQVKPVKRAGGRRYYRPADMLLLGGIKKLLHEDGLTIKGAQKLLRENGVTAVADMSQPLDDLTMAVIEGNEQSQEGAEDIVTLETPEPVAFEDETPDVDIPDVSEPPQQAEVAPPVAPPQKFEEPPEPVNEEVRPLVEQITEVKAPEPVEDIPQVAEAPESAPEVEPEPLDTPPPAPEPVAEADEDVEPAAEMPSFRASPRESAPSIEEVVEPAPAEGELPLDAPVPEAEDTSPPEVPAEALIADTPPTEPSAPDPIAVEEPEPAPAAIPKPRIVEIPPVPPATEFTVAPSTLSALAEIKEISPEIAREIKPWLARLTRLRASIASPRKEFHKD